VPPPRVNLIRYHGALAPGARLRPALAAQAVAGAARAGSPPVAGPLGRTAPRRSRVGSRSPPPQPIPIVSDPVPAPCLAPRRRSLLWVELLVRVFAFDLICTRCGGRLRPIAVVTEREAAARVLRHLDLATAPPTLAPARATPGDDPALTFSARPHALRSGSPRPSCAHRRVDDSGVPQ
jgi:hypothetical protein